VVAPSRTVSAGLTLATGLTTRLGAKVSAVEPAWESRLK